MTTDAERDTASRTFANALTAGGSLFLEVREAEGSVTACRIGETRGPPPLVRRWRSFVLLGWMPEG